MDRDGISAKEVISIPWGDATIVSSLHYVRFTFEWCKERR